MYEVSNHLLAAFLIVYGVISFSILSFQVCENLDFYGGMAKGLFWPIYLIVGIIKAIIQDINDV